jgi:hypothetical protein
MLSEEEVFFEFEEREILRTFPSLECLMHERRNVTVSSAVVPVIFKVSLFSVEVW